MNEEKSRKMFLAVLFGIMGMVLLIIAWLVPADASDRIIAAAAGSAGLFAAVIRIPALKRTTRPEAEQRPASVRVEEKP